MDASSASDVLALNEQYIAAVFAHDVEWFRRHMAEDVVVIMGDGRRADKTDFLRTLAEEPARYRSLDLRDARARVFGATVQVDADAPFELEDATRGVSRYIDTYAWIDGRWQVISAQVTRLPAEGACP
jgi:hypothetical protein